MPFTFSHPALVLPVYSARKRWFSLTGLITGSIVPDFEYFFRLQKGPSVYSHTILSLLWFSLPLGFVLALIFHAVVKRPLIGNLPGSLNQRFARYYGVQWWQFCKRHLALVAFSILFGAATHLFWDWLTHRSVEWFSINRDLEVVPGDWRTHISFYEVLHFAFSIVGIAVILLYLRRMPVHGNEKPSSEKSVFWGMIVLFTFLITALRVILSSNLVTKDVATTIIAAFLLSLLLSSVYQNIIDKTKTLNK